MHHARRSVCLKRPGTRAAATATKAARAPGKWALPESPSPSPQDLAKWARPSALSRLPTPQALSQASQQRLGRVKGGSDGNNRWHKPNYKDRAQESPSQNRPASRFGFRDNNRTSTKQHETSLRPDPGKRHEEPTRTYGRESQFSLLDELEVIGHQDRKRSKDAYKQRGSLVRGRTAEIYRPGVVAESSGSHKKEEKRSTKPKTVRKVKPDVYIPSVVTVGTLSKLLNVRLDRLVRKMVQSGMNDEATHDHMLTAEYASLIAMEFGRNPIVNDEAAFDIYPPAPHPEPSTLPARPPIVTIMGHVDHGKTTLLDSLRSSSVAAGEAGGITQHIGAFSVEVPSSDPSSSTSRRTITFLDTPGHAAFSSMRARGASVTDVVVLVVAADDGIMPQTREVLELVKREGDKVALIVAINKVDKPGANIEEVEKALLAADVQLETFGGDVPVVHVSGLTGQGLPQLVETISLVAEMKDLRAEDTGPAHGYILESKVSKGLGPVATVLLLRGSLTPGSHVICGTTQGRVRLITSPSGQSIQSVGPGQAAVVSGWKEVPNAGDEVLSGPEACVRRASANRIRRAEIEATMDDIEHINESRRADRERKEAEDRGDDAPLEEHESKAVKMLRLIIKGDVSGTVEAVAGSLQGIGNHLAGVKIVSTGVGPVTEADVMRAKASEASIVAFGVTTPRSVKAEADEQHVPIIESDVIYRLMDQVQDKVIALLPPIIETRVTGEATVLQLFDISMKRQTKRIAGCRVINGIVHKNRKVRVVRGGETVYDGAIETLKNQKRDITEAGKGLECGMSFEDWQDLHEGDLIQIYQVTEKPGAL